MVRTRSSKSTRTAPAAKKIAGDDSDEWTDDPMDLDTAEGPSQGNSQYNTNANAGDRDADHDDEEEEEDDDDDDPDASLTRLSQQYRRYSESQRIHHHPDDDVEEEADDDDDDDADMMVSIHQTQEDRGDGEDEEDQEDGDNNSEDQEDESNDEDAEEDRRSPSALLEGALRSFANSMNGGGGNQRQASSTLAENMARIFPEAMGLFEGLGGNGSGNIRGLIDGLAKRDDPYLVLETLNELSSRLLMMNGLMAERGLPAYDLSRALVTVMNEPRFMDELELQLVACRCLYNLLEINPDYVSSVVDSCAIEALQTKLLEISSIDLAEQALQTLEFISRFAGTRIFRKNCLTSCLQYLDFFTIHAQRKAINIAANSVKHIRPSEFHLVEEILPTLQRVVLEFTDSQEVEKAWLAITRIIKNFKANSLLEKLVTFDLLKKIVSVVSNSDTSLSTTLRLINVLSICADNQTLGSMILENGTLVTSLNAALSKYKKGPDSSISIAVLMAAPKDLVISSLDLLITLLPVESNSILTSSHGGKKDYSMIYESYTKFINEIFPLLINIYQSTVVFEIRRRVIICLVRISFSLKDIKDLDNSLSITNLLASIVIQNKSIIRTDKKNIAPYVNLVGALLVTQSFIEKGSESFISEFEREGLLSDTSSLLEVLRAEEQSFDDAEFEEEQSEEEEEEENHSDEDDNDDEEDDDDEDDEIEFDDDQEIEGRSFSSSSTRYSGSQFRVLSIPVLLKHLTRCASTIEQLYLSKKASGSSKLGHLRLLDELNADLTDDQLTSSYTSENWLSIWRNFQKALSQGSYVISSFELISSGIIEVLFHLFSDAQYGSEGSACRNAFLQVFEGDSFEVLVKKLQEALTRSELFEIIGCGLKTGENKVASLGKQLKLKLVAIDDENDFFNGLSEFVILVHAIAGFNNIGTFLKRRAEAPLLFGGSRRTQTTESSNWFIEFVLDGEVIPSDTTIYGALYRNLQTKNPNFDTNRFWYDIHEIKFRKVEGVQPFLELDDRYPESCEDDFEAVQHSKTIGILNLLKTLYDFNDKSTSFHNFKLTAKLNRQLEEPLIVASGILPPWSIHITRKYPFLFPLETRIFFLQSTSFGYSRLVQLWNTRVNQEETATNGNGSSSSVSLGRPTKYKVRVSRKHLLQSAYKVMEKLSSNPAILEIEFNDEVGTGLGPTLEFYSNVSHLFAKKKLGIWRIAETDKDAEYIESKNGLFPAPLNLENQDYKERIEHFKYLGKFIARALLDNRIVDIHFNRLFFELASLEVGDQKYSLPKVAAFEKLKYVDERLYQSLRFMRDNKSTVSDLCVTFSLPGYDSIELKPNGGDILVDESNVEEYIERVVDYTIGSGIKEQIQTFIAGFSEVFPFYSLLIFSPNEMVQLLGKSEEDWSYETLISVIHADHGYSIDSPTVQNLLTTLAGFDLPQRRLFLQFLTGSPRLPIGGFKNLKPELTVVLKHSEDGLKPDDYLPSVMTCANYLKLPNYTTLEILKQRLDQAVNQGAGAFLLS